jgi:hypothetical protein
LPSNAFDVHLRQLLADANQLDAIHNQLRTGAPGRQYGLDSLNRAAMVISVSAWESFIEELLRECLQVLQPAAPPFDPWPALNAFVLGELGRFNTPNSEKVANLLDRCISLPDIRVTWSWQNCSSAQAVTLLDEALDLRHQIAHGVNPRPIIHNQYSSWLPGFFIRLARCTDRAVRNHLINVHHIAIPWPP